MHAAVISADGSNNISMHCAALPMHTCTLHASLLISMSQNKEKVNNAVLFEKPVYDKMLAEVPKYKMITQVRRQVDGFIPWEGR